MPRFARPGTMKIVAVPAAFLARHVAGQETRRHGGIADLRSRAEAVGRLSDDVTASGLPLTSALWAESGFLGRDPTYERHGGLWHSRREIE
jgi:hypothetical protein